MKQHLTDDRGQVGIGTLIVFIALVLVAAIAAGVLINTAGFLQTQAEQTGTESTDQVSNNIEVVGAIGEVPEGKSDVTVANVTVQRAAGSGDVNLSEVSVEFIGEQETVIITDGLNDNSELDNNFGVDPLVAEDSSGAVLTDSSDRYRMVFDFNSQDDVDLTDNGGLYSTDPGVSDIESLGAGESALLRFTTQDGATREARLSVPDNLSGGDTVDLLR
jgi:flagellin FlaB